MRRVLSDPILCLVLGIALIVVVLLSSVPELWGTSIIAFTVALVALGWHLAPPVLTWLIAINMFSIWADVARIELNGSDWAYGLVEAKMPDAIIQSSCAMAFLAIGMRCGLVVGRSMFGYRPDVVQNQAASVSSYSAYRISLTYVAFLPTSALVDIVGQAVLGLSQAAYMFGLLKFALIYLLAAKAFATGRNIHLLIGVIGAEIVIGSTGYFASYKEGFFVVLIALAASSRRLSFKQVVFVLAGVVAMLYISLGWTAVKTEYRVNIAGSDALTSVAWLADKYFGGEFDLAAAAVDLLGRVGYTKFYAMIMSANTEGIEGIYQRALLHVVTPRVLFPDKAILSDSAQTAQALSWSIAKGTSIGLGYVAQAHVDFGFPGLLVPMIVLGAIVGTIYAYFLTRPAPPLIREAFAVACLFNTIRFEFNIDKQFGGLIMALLVLAFALRYGAGILRQWLEYGRQDIQNRPYRHRVNVQKRHTGVERALRISEHG